MKRDDKVTTAFTLLSYVVRSFVRCVAKPNKDSSSSTFYFFSFSGPAQLWLFFFYYLSFTAHFSIISPPEEFLVHAPQNFFSLPNQRSGYTLQN
jgi:hypothetical protein